MWEEKKNKENVSVRRKRIFAAILLYFCLLLFVANDAWVYQTPIVKITEVHTKESRKEEDVRGGREPYYTQNIKGILLNGEKKGKTVRLNNEYSYSGVLDQKYAKGDKVLVTLEGDSLKRNDQKFEKGYPPGSACRGAYFPSACGYEGERDAYHPHGCGKFWNFFPWVYRVPEWKRSACCL